MAEIARAIWDCLVEDYMPDNNRRLGSHFCWNFPSYLGSIDGKLFASVDAKYYFCVVDVMLAVMGGLVTEGLWQMPPLAKH